MTVNSSKNEPHNISREAELLIEKLRRGAGNLSPTTADDLLLFLYRLRDGYQIVRSTSAKFKGSSFSFLHELLYQLESHPEDTLRSEEWKSLIDAVLSDLASGRFLVRPKTK